MGLEGILLQLITKIEPLVPVMLFCAGVTFVVIAILYIMAGDVWIDQGRFRVLGAFFGLNGYDGYRLSLSWVRFLMTLFFVVAFRNLELETDLRQVARSPQYAAYLLVGVLYALDFKRPQRILKNVFWFLVVSCGLFATSIMCGYMQSLPKFNFGVFMIYAFMGIFMTLFAFYLFLLEVDEVSKDRSINPLKEYEKSLKEKHE